jgi:hypothetical protein
MRTLWPYHSKSEKQTNFGKMALKETQKTRFYIVEQRGTIRRLLHAVYVFHFNGHQATPFGFGFDFKLSPSFFTGKPFYHSRESGNAKYISREFLESR